MQRKKALSVASSLVVALVLGTGSAWWFIDTDAFENVGDGPWQYDPLIGSEAAGLHLRARVAWIGLLALNRSETLYFFASTDSNGDPLRCDGDYRVEGRPVDARWWSLTAYGDDRFLIENPQHRYSYHGDNIGLKADGSYQVRVCRESREGNWIPCGDGEHFDLVLRVYDAAPRHAEDPSTLDLPRIVPVERTP